MRVTTICLLVFIATIGWISDAPRASILGDVTDRPVFLETRLEQYAGVTALKSLRQGSLAVSYYAPVPLEGFDWVTSPHVDETWWEVAERLIWLVPAISSSHPPDNALARHWFDGWLRAHPPGAHPNIASWKDPMTVAWRVLVFVYWVRRLELEPTPDESFVGILRGLTWDHGEFLAQHDNFGANSNHGLIEALALLEATRVAPDDDWRRIAWDRLYGMARRIASPSGVSREHSGQYHFFVARVMDEIVRYVSRFPNTDTRALSELLQTREAMIRASWFLCDHGGRILQVGDSDSIRADVYLPPSAVTRIPPSAPDLYDDDAGLAIFKGVDRDQRYVSFCLQNRTPFMPFHFQDDALSVTLSCAGESILGDSGRFRYSHDARLYYGGALAHNRPIRGDEFVRVRAPRGFVLATRPWHEVHKDGTRRFGANIVERPLSARRGITIPPSGVAMIVDDTLRADPGAIEAPEARLVHVAWHAGADVVSVTCDEDSAAARAVITLRTRSGDVWTATTDLLHGGGWHGVDLYYGSLSPFVGWYSPEYRVERPSYTVIVHVEPFGDAIVRTTVRKVTRDIGWPGLRILWRGY